MKARVKNTGEIVEVKPCGEWTTMHGDILAYRTNDGIQYSSRELSFNIDDNKTEPIDYWTRLEHQYAGMAMQQLVTLVNVGYEYVYEETAIVATNFAHALVEKLKESK